MAARSGVTRTMPASPTMSSKRRARSVRRRLLPAFGLMTTPMPLSAGLQFERELFVTAFASEDRSEGVRAFLERREPDFQGR